MYETDYQELFIMILRVSRFAPNEREILKKVFKYFCRIEHSNSSMNFFQKRDQPNKSIILIPRTTILLFKLKNNSATLSIFLRIILRFLHLEVDSFYRKDD